MEHRGSVGPYLLEGVLGSGGMGVVYRAQSPGGAAVAVKVLHDRQADADRARRFEREAGIRIDHPNVIRVLDAGTDADGTLFIVLELLEGEPLRSRLDRRELSVADVLDVGRQVCAGLGAAHERGIIHRDLKPSNLFCTTDGAVKILDFGVARSSSAQTRLTTTGSVIGTPTYLSPEQARGQGEADARTDLWSLGVVLYEAVTGRTPFERDTPLATVVAILLEPIVPLAIRAPRAPAALAAVVERALRKPVRERWGSAAEMAIALAAIDRAACASIPAGQSAPIAEGSMAETSESGGPCPPARPAEERVVTVVLARGVRDAPHLERCLVEHGGELLPLVGDRAVGLFGGESLEGDEALRATAAALRARTACAAIAVAAGRATRSGTSITGTALRVAEEGCRADLSGVAVDTETARSLGEQFTVREVTGTIWEARSVAPKTPDTAAVRPTRGREPELAQIGSSLQTVLEEGRAQAILVTGPPGIGKSRLRHELEHRLSPPVAVLRGRADWSKREDALSLFSSALRPFFGLDTGGPEHARDEILGTFREASGDTSPRARETAAFLGELIGLAPVESTALDAARRDPQLMADRLRMAIHDLLRGLADRAPVALLLEDLQWADDASLELLVDVLDRLSDAPLLLFATARPELVEDRSSLFDGRDIVRIAPRGLASRDVAALAADIAGNLLPASLVTALTDRTGGNPLFVEQIVMALRDQDLLSHDIEGLPLPLTVEAAVQSRLDHLRPEEKELCKRASLFGRPFSIEEIELLGVPGADAALAALCRRDILSVRGPARRHSFRNALLAEVSYRLIPDGLRQELHRRAAALLLAAPDADAEEVASHHERGGQAILAARRYAAAALAAAVRGDGRKVLRCSDRALDLGVPVELRFGLHMARVDALRFAGSRDQQEQEIRSAIEHASTPAERARALTEQAVWLSRTGRTSTAVEVADAAVVAARDAGDVEAIVLALGRQAMALQLAGRLALARQSLDELEALAASCPARLQALAAAWRAQLATALGDLGGRRDGFRLAARLYAEVGDVRRSANAETNLADAYNRVGAYAEAEIALRSALEGCRRVGSRVMEGYALLNLGYSLAMRGEPAQALAALEEAAAVATSLADARLSVWVEVYRARALLATGARVDVVGLAARAADEAAKLGLSALCVLALCMEARAREAAGDLPLALASSRRAMDILVELGSIEEDEAEVFATHARLLERAGRHEEAGQVRSSARARLGTIADGIADPVWRARFLSDVAAHRELLA